MSRFFFIDFDRLLARGSSPALAFVDFRDEPVFERRVERGGLSSAGGGGDAAALLRSLIRFDDRPGEGVRRLGLILVPSVRS
jgi:hypothetical protein